MFSDIPLDLVVIVIEKAETFGVEFRPIIEAPDRQLVATDINLLSFFSAHAKEQPVLAHDPVPA